MKSTRWICLLLTALIGIGGVRGQEGDFFSQYEPISPENAHQLISIGDLGYGYPLIPHWSPNGESLAFSMANGFFLWSEGDEKPVFIRRPLQSLTWLSNHQIAIADPDNMIYSWDKRTGEWTLLFDSELISVYGLDYNASADVFIMRGEDLQASLYKGATGELIGKISCRFGFGFITKDYVFSLDGIWFACADDTQATMLNLQSGEFVLLSDDAVESPPQFNADSSIVAYATQDRTVHLMKTADQSVIATYAGSSLGTFSPDSRLYVAETYFPDLETPTQFIVWDIETNSQIASFAGSGSIAFSSDGSLIAYQRDLADSSDCLYNELYVYDLQHGAATPIVEGRYVVTMAGAYPVEFRANNLFVVSETSRSPCDGGRIGVWNETTGLRQIAEFSGRLDYALSPNGRFVTLFSLPMFSGTSVNWRVIALDDGREVFPPTRFPPSDYWHSLSFSPDGEWITTGGGNENLQQWFVEDMGQTSREFGSTGYPSQAPVNDLAYSPDGRLIASAAEDFTSGTVWDVETGEILASIQGRFDAVTFSSDGQTLIMGRDDGHVVFYALSDLLVMSEDEIPSPSHEFMPDAVSSGRMNVTDVAINARGTLIVATSLDHMVHLWDVESGALLQTHQLEDEVWGVAFSPNREEYVASGGDNTVAIFKVASGEMIDLALDPVDEDLVFYDVVYSRDGSLIAAFGYGSDASGNESGALILWSAQTHERLNRMEVSSDGLPFHLEFSSDGKFLAAAASRSETVHLWGVENLEGTNQ